MTTRVPLRKVVRRPLLGACHEWTGATWQKNPKYGAYGKRFYKGRTWAAHRAAWDEQVGPIPRGKNVCHRCDNRLCVRLSHLFVGTKSENVRDCVAKGRHHGWTSEHNPKRKLTPSQVRAIRRRYVPRVVTQVALAREYGVSQTQISKILLGVSW